MLSKIAAVAALLGLAACSAADGSSLDDGGSGSGDELTSGSGAGAAPGSGSSGSGIDDACGSSTFGNEVPGTLLIVLDKSGSMSEDAGGSTKWSGTVAALETMIDAASQTLEVGLLPFPAGMFNEASLINCTLNPGAPGCADVLADGGCKDVANVPAVPIAPLSESGAGISQWLSDNGPNGGTPTRYALLNAYQILKAESSLGQRYVLLITDGVPNTAMPALGPFPAMQSECGQLSDIEQAVLTATNGSPSVNTFVIGSPGSEGAKQHLSQLALNGKTPKDPACAPSSGNCHYQIGSSDFETELQEVLAAIAGAISDCVFDLPLGQEDVDPDLVNVEIETADGPVQIFKDSSHQDGWDYADGAQTKIQLFGPACELYKQQKGNTITIILGCETILK